MLEKILAKRYAQALFGAAEAEAQVEVTEQNLSAFWELYESNPALAQILSHPLIPSGQKQEFLNKLTSNFTTPLVGQFIQLLTRKNRIKYLSEVVAAYHTRADIWRGIVRVSIRSFYPLSPDQLNTLEHKLRTRGHETGQIIFQTTVDHSLLGGLVMQIGDAIIDGSAAGQLNRLQQRLLYSTE